MVANSKLQIISNLKLWFVAAVFATMLFIGSALSINAAPYGACSYSTGDFSASADCEPDTGSLPGTGRNWNNLLFAALGLLLGVSSLITVIILMKKRSPRGIKT